MVNSYAITWSYRDADGELTSTTDTLAYGATPTAPTLPGTCQSASTVYTFTSWDPTVDEVTGTQTYTAQYTETPREYTITWTYKNADGSAGSTTTIVAYGTVPTPPSVSLKC